MPIDFSSGVGIQITNLVNSLDQKNYRNNVNEIEKLTQTYGHEAYRFLLRYLLKSINFHNLVQKDQFKFKLLKQEFAKLTTQTNFVSLIIEVFEDNENNTQVQFLSLLGQNLNLPLSQQVLMGLGFAQSKDSNTQQEGKNFLKMKIPEILEQGPSVLPETIINHLLQFVNTSPDFTKERERIMKTFSGYANNLIMSPHFSSADSVVNSRRGVSHDSSHIYYDDTSMLSGVMAQLGYSCCANSDIFSKVLSQFNNITDQDIAKAIGLIAMTHTGLQPNTSFQMSFYSSINENNFSSNANSWNIDAFVSAVKKRYPKLNWRMIIRLFDFPGFKLHDQRGLANIAQIYKKLTDEALPVEAIVKEQWNNTDGQLSFISLGIDAPPDTLNFSSPNLRQVNLGNVTSLVRSTSPVWSCLDLIETLLNLAEGENYKKCRKLFDYPIKHCPEQLVIGLAEAKPRHIGLQTELLNTLVTTFIRPHKHSFPVLHQLMSVNPLLLINTLSETYCRDPSTLRRILDIAQELKALDIILSAKPYRFVIELATFAAKRDHLNLEHWLSKNIEQHRNPFIIECINFLNEKSAAMKDTRSEKSVTPDCINVFYKVLKDKKNLIPSELYEQIFSSSQMPHNEGMMDNEFPISEEVEQQANNFFTDIFNSNMSIEQAIELLKNMKASKSEKDQSLFACVIHNLFDEYRFFDQYPPEQLKKVAKLFGAIIHNNIIVARTLRYALIYVLQALESQNVKMVQFALIALNQFKTRLPEWPQVCTHLRASAQLLQTSAPDIIFFLNQVQPAATATATQPVIPSNLQGFSNLPGIQQNVQAIQQNMQNLQHIQSSLQNMSTSGMMSSANVGNMQQNQPTVTQPVSTPSMPSTPTRDIKKLSGSDEKEGTSGGSLGFQLDISTLTQNASENKMIRPDDEVADKIIFILNNLSMTNLPDKGVELERYLKPELYPYFASYLVTNRASLEPNFHKLYAKFLSTVNIKPLEAEIQQFTYTNIRALLDSEKIKTSISERSLLKNLGSWLGHLTIEKNKPILQKDLDLKNLLFDAYENGKLIAVIPFVCKVLNHCQNSKVIKPPNPWVMGLISLLAEIHALPELKLNLKFEVEMLCKNLNLVLSQIETKNMLENRIPHSDVLLSNNPMSPDIKRGSISVAPEISRPQQTMPLFNESLVSDIPLGIPELPEHVKIDPSLQLFNDQPSLRRFVIMAVDTAIRDIVAPVVKRSVTIASRTTAHLVTKDFASEPDASKMNRAAQLMAQNLAAKLAMVTSKDLLKNSIKTYLSNALKTMAVDQNDVNLMSEIEQIAEIISNDNVDLGCLYVENAATERASIGIKEALSSEFEMRMNYQQGKSQIWTMYNMNNYSRNLPTRLVPRNGLTRQHLQVYEDFRSHSPSSDEVSQLLPPAQAIERINEVLADIVKTAKKVKKPTTIFSLSLENELTALAVSITSIIMKSQSLEETSITVMKSVFLKYFEAENQLLREVFFIVLEGLQSCWSGITKHTNEFWISHNDDKKFTKELVPCLIRSGLVYVNDLDIALASKLASDSKNAKNLNKLAIYLVKKLVLAEKCIICSEIPRVVEYLSKHAKKLSDTHTNVSDLLELASTILPLNKVVSESRLTLLIQSSTDFENQERETLRDKLNTKLENWMRLINAPRAVFGAIGEKQDKKKKSIEEQKQTVLNEFVKLGVLKTDGDFQIFCQMLMQASIIDFNQNKSFSVKPAVLFKYVDTFTDLCSNLIFKKAEKSKRVSLMKNLLLVASRILVRDHEVQGEKFNQRVYLRFFSNMLIEMSDILGAISSTEPIASHDHPVEQAETSTEYLEILLLFADSFLQLEPSKLQGFSFAWLELVSHRMFIPKLFFSKNKDGWLKFHDLLITLLSFLKPYTSHTELSGPIRLLYRGTLKILLILLHDFPEILCNYHFSLCDVIPPTCIQMRNLILSAFPRNMRLPDPFTPNLKVDLLAEIKQPPKILSHYYKALEESTTITKDQVDGFLTKTRPSRDFLSNLRTNLMLPPSSDASQPRYNVPLLNSLVLYVGVQAITQPQQEEASLVNTTAMSLFEHLIVNLDEEGRYLFLNALANQLRYPNNHTHYFSCVLLYLFSEIGKTDQTIDFREEIQEQITRVLLERLIVNRPHPWGLLITFIELVKNPRYQFWNKPFVHCAADIERLFENVGRSL